MVASSRWRAGVDFESYTELKILGFLPITHQKVNYEDLRLKTFCLWEWAVQSYCLNLRKLADVKRTSKKRESEVSS